MDKVLLSKENHGSFNLYTYGTKTTSGVIVESVTYRGSSASVSTCFIPDTTLRTEDEVTTIVKIPTKEVS